MSTQSITYGTFSFPFSRLSVAQETVYSDNKVDVIGIAYTFTVTGWLTAANEAEFNTLIQQTKCQLNTPRLGLTIKWTGASDEVLYSFDNKGDDILWGPKPSTVNIGPFVGGKAALYSWQVRVVEKKCYDGSCSLTNPPSNVLTITRKFDHRINENGYTTRTISGVLVVTSGSVTAGSPADAFRFLVTPNLPNWYRRVSAEYSQSEDGTQLTYSITDQEVQWTLPAPITSGNASYTERFEFMGMMVHYVLSGEFSAPANVSKKAIIEQILQLAQDKFPIRNSNIALIPDQREFTEDIYGSNTVRFMISARSVGGADIVDPFSIFAGVPTFGFQPTNSTGQSQLIGVYGGDGVNVTSGVIADSISIFDACNPRSRPSVPGSISSGTGQVDFGNSGPGKTGPSGEFNTAQNAYASYDHAIAPYISVHEKLSWEVDNGWQIFYPKKAGAKPITQQVRMPSVKILQCGYITRDIPSNRLDLKPSPPSPIFTSHDDIRILRYSINPETPEPLGDGSYTRFTIHYSYVMELVKAIQATEDLVLQYPVDPRRDGGQDLDNRKVLVNDDDRLLDIPDPAPPSSTGP